jgi:hypothetical protein
MKDSSNVTPLTEEEQWAMFRNITLQTRARKAEELPPFIQRIERDEDNVTFYVTFTESLDMDKRAAVIEDILSEHKDEYIARAQWTRTGKLMICLRKPRRDVHPDSRRLFRGFVGLTASQAFRTHR